LLCKGCDSFKKLKYEGFLEVIKQIKKNKVKEGPALKCHNSNHN
jgi:hypothetical protein